MTHPPPQNHKQKNLKPTPTILLVISATGKLLVANTNVFCFILFNILNIIYEKTINTIKQTRKWILFLFNSVLKLVLKYPVLLCLWQRVNMFLHVVVILLQRYSSHYNKGKLLLLFPLSLLYLVIWFFWCFPLSRTQAIVIFIVAFIVAFSFELRVYSEFFKDAKYYCVTALSEGHESRKVVTCHNRNLLCFLTREHIYRLDSSVR